MGGGGRPVRWLDGERHEWRRCVAKWCRREESDEPRDALLAVHSGVGRPGRVDQAEGEGKGRKAGSGKEKRNGATLDFGIWIFILSFDLDFRKFGATIIRQLEKA